MADLHSRLNSRLRLSLVVLQVAAHSPSTAGATGQKAFLATGNTPAPFAAGPGGAPALADLAGGDRRPRSASVWPGPRRSPSSRPAGASRSAARRAPDRSVWRRPETQNAAQRVAHEIDRLAVPLDLLLCMYSISLSTRCGQWLRPGAWGSWPSAARRRVPGCRAGAQQRKQQAIGTRWESCWRARRPRAVSVEPAGCCSGLGHERRTGYEKRPKARRRSVDQFSAW